MNYQNNKTETSVIQLALKRAGVLDGEIDGIFGSDTRNAVISFQKAASLCPTELSVRKHTPHFYRISKGTRFTV